jgi:hypothetical protein
VTGLVYALRYFAIVSVVPQLFVVGFAVVWVIGTSATVLGDGRAVDALAPLLFMQMFAASSGFDLPARRGHYDLLLTSGVSRWQIGAAHCLTSILPGVAAWVSMELWLSWLSRDGAFATGSLVAFLSVSLVAWATAVPTSRAVSSVGWLVVMTAPGAKDRILPTTLIGHSLFPWTFAAGGGVAVAWVLVAVFAVAAAGVHIRRGAVPLEASQ